MHDVVIAVIVFVVLCALVIPLLTVPSRHQRHQSASNRPAVRNQPFVTDEEPDTDTAYRWHSGRPFQGDIYHPQGEPLPKRKSDH